MNAQPPIHGLPALEGLAYLNPARWGMAASAATVSMPGFLPSALADPVWQHRAEYWTRPALILVIQIVVMLLAMRVALRRFEPGQQ